MKRILVPILIIGILLLSACGALTTAPETETPSTPKTEQPTPITYTLSIAVSPSGAGSVSPSGGQYEEGSPVTLTAIPASGYTFDYWGGDASGSSLTITITTDSNKNIIAHFSIIDIAPPVISEVNASKITESSATIAWITDEPATSQIEYGKTTDYGLTTTLEEELVISHSVSLSGLETNTTYHFRVKSKDEAGNEALSGDYTFTTSRAATEAGGIISSNTLWPEENSPYLITSTIQVPAGVTLTIEPGVTVTMSDGELMFLVHGTLYAQGTSDKRITFDGENSAILFSTQGGDSETFLDLDYCVIQNLVKLQGYPLLYGGFSLTHSELRNLAMPSLITDPERDIRIEYNTFSNAWGFETHLLGDGKVYIRYNLFDGKSSPLGLYWIRSRRSLSPSQMTVRYNSFVNTEGTVLVLAPGYETAYISAVENYWGTTDTDIIQQKIYDRNDDIRVKNYIDYLPILTEPHPSTPSPD